jgi:hypothetical protein
VHLPALQILTILRQYPVVSDRSGWFPHTELEDIKAFFILDWLVMPSLKEFHFILTHPHTERHFNVFIVDSFFNIAPIQQLHWCRNLQKFHLDIIGAAQEAEFTDDEPLEIPPEVLRKFVKRTQVDVGGHVWGGSKVCVLLVKDYVIL